jgi:hypothetical protein
MATRNTGLQNLLEGIQGAIIGAQDLMQKQHTDEMKKLFYKNGKPKVQKVKMPYLNTNNEIEYRNIDVPLMALTPPSALKISKLNVKFEAKLHGIGPPEGKPAEKSGMKLSLGGMFNRGTTVQCEIQFEGTEPPEGWMLINDELVKVIH